MWKTQRAGEEEKVRTTTVMFLQSTKGEILLKRMNENEGNMSQLSGFRVKYAEAGGIQLAKLFSTSLANDQPCG